MRNSLDFRLADAKLTKQMRIFEKNNLKQLLNENYPLLCILIGVVLISVSLGPYQNWDTQVEFDAASGVFKWGIPYLNSFGKLMDQPPLGFYFEALFFKIFGLSIVAGTSLVTAFGLGCTVLVYKIGKAWYTKTTGLVAATLFALTPWEMVLSRSFLIDVQCLFFSLLCLFIGIFAVRKDSFKGFVFSGALFAVAFLTKFYAVFTLIPLILFFAKYSMPRNLKRTFSWLGAFFFPSILSVFLWYQIISGIGIFSIFSHSDFIIQNSSGVVPSYFFVGNFLVNYGLGWFSSLPPLFRCSLAFLYENVFRKFLFLI